MRVVFGGCVVSVRGVCAGEGGARYVRPRECCVLVGWSRCACAGLTPRAPLLLVGGRRRARGGMVRAEDAGLCALEIRGLSPLTPVEAVQGCPPAGVDARRRMGSFGSCR